MKFSVGKKIAASILASTLILGGTCICASGIAFRQIMTDEYRLTADSMAATIVSSLDAKTVETVSSDFNKGIDVENTESYKDIEGRLDRIREVSEVDHVFLFQVDREKDEIVIILDSAYENEMGSGKSLEIEGTFRKYLDDPDIKKSAAVLKATEAGELVVSCEPIFGEQEDIICFVGVDLSMSDVIDTENHFLLILTGVLLVLVAVVSLILFLFARDKIVRPVKLLTTAAENYISKKNEKYHNEFSSLDIRTGDEIEILHKSMVKMEVEIDNHIEEVTKAQEEMITARLHADDMRKKAFLDSLTGIHNRLAYDKKMMEIENMIPEGCEAFGIAVADLNFLKNINDEYGHEKGDTAIIRLSQILCKIFERSQVFRIGGGEFAVLLRGKDCDDIEMLKRKFDSDIKAVSEDKTVSPHERISAAFGYALYDRDTDRHAEDVFRRADRNMYQVKKMMKLKADKK